MFDNEKSQSISGCITYSIDHYDGDERVIHELAHHLRRELQDKIIGAYLHGSQATQEANAFSDVDALVILRDLDNRSAEKAVLKKLIHSQKYFYKLDPLQHHGWFILKESQLKQYPQTYFPHEIFEYCRSLYPDKGRELSICYDESRIDYVQPLRDLCASLLGKLDRGWRPQNLYSLKSFLSEFMLLPALYVQARDRAGVFKKFSFSKARHDFTAEQWLIMDEISVIRAEWHYTINRWQKYLLTRSNKYFRKMAVQFAAPKIPDEIDQKLAGDFYERTKLLIDQILVKIHEFESN